MNEDTNEVLASILDEDDRYKVLKRLEPPCPGPDLLRDASRKRIVLLDLETTGLDPKHDVIIELAVMQLELNGQNEVIAFDAPRSWLQDPGRELPERIEWLTGLDHIGLANHRIDDDAVIEIISNADLCVAHNARFDRAFFEHRYPELSDKAWACSMVEIDWLELEFDGRSLNHLAMQLGFFNNAHRAPDDVWTLFHLLRSAPKSRFDLGASPSLFDRLIRASERPSYRVEAVGAPFSLKDRLKARRYNWDSARRVWWIEVDQTQFPDEEDWLRGMGLNGFIAKPVDATRRHL